MRVLLIQPKESHPRFGRVTVSIPLGLCYLAAVLRQKGHTVEILDCLAEGYKHRVEKFGGYVLPGSFKSAIPGSDVHYAGTARHSNDPKIYETNINGEIKGLSNSYVVDASVLPILPTKPHTLTLMANADRIAKEIIKKFTA